MKIVFRNKKTAMVVADVMMRSVVFHLGLYRLLKYLLQGHKTESVKLCYTRRQKLSTTYIFAETTIDSEKFMMF